MHIVAERFSFTPSEIRVEQGSVLELRITSDDTSHGFRLVGPGGTDVEIPKRGRGDVRVRFEAAAERDPDAGAVRFEELTGAQRAALLAFLHSL